ncbi:MULTISPECIES: protein translocase subunit SecD [Ferrimicrobium]|jgi:preprotein translocase subunit SecD|uniref:Protein translocase subunit SecD n=1 Tax=Ferrimicrobium acidiphilum TaxID=121039 RepID=A0ABV3Y5L8_9ACTN|nr:protein translocase subunit SecD [Ferrimicrobium sp.]
MRKGRWIRSVLISTVVAVAAFVAVISAHYHPVLGLDLQGGASVVYKPARKVSASTLNETISIIENRVNALGVGQPSIGQQGSDIVVDLPGVKDPKTALSYIGQTAILQFRPVLCQAPLYTKPPASLHLKKSQLTPTCPNPSAKTASLLQYVPSTSPLKATSASTALLPEYQGNSKKVIARYVVGPTLLTGNAIKSVFAAPQPQSASNQWAINFTLTAKGAPIFNQIAKTYYHQLLAVVLDGTVQSAPQINSTNFNGQGQITGNYTRASATDLATILHYGALPVQLVQQTVQTISPTLGAASLRAGLVAGIAGLILVMLYTILYYRLLGLVVVGGLATTFGALWAIIALLGHTEQLTLDLSGVTGIIVSIGVIVDSYIVFFERLKDEARHGKSLRASVDTGFSKAFRTIIAADLVSFIGAALLYYFSIGDVRGFAFFLGLSTILDVASAWFFTRPLVLWIGNTIDPKHYRWLGVPVVQVTQKPIAGTGVIKPSRRVVTKGV